MKITSGWRLTVDRGACCYLRIIIFVLAGCLESISNYHADVMQRDTPAKLFHESQIDLVHSRPGDRYVALKKRLVSSQHFYPRWRRCNKNSHQHKNYGQLNWHHKRDCLLQATVESSISCLHSRNLYNPLKWSTNFRTGSSTNILVIFWKSKL